MSGEQKFLEGLAKALNASADGKYMRRRTNLREGLRDRQPARTAGQYGQQWLAVTGGLEVDAARHPTVYAAGVESSIRLSPHPAGSARGLSWRSATQTHRATPGSHVAGSDEPYLHPP